MTKEVAPADPPPLSDEEKEYERRKHECYAQNTATLNSSKEKAAEQFDKTVSAIATAALGFSFAVFARVDRPEPWLAELALLVMGLFSCSIFSSLLSFLATFHSVKRCQSELDRWYDGDESAQPNAPDWLDKVVVWLNWFSLGFLFIGIVTFVWVGYAHLKRSEDVSNESGSQPPKVVSVNESAGRPAIVIERQATQVKGGAGRPTISLPTPAMSKPPVETPRPPTATTSAPPPNGGK